MGCQVTKPKHIQSAREVQDVRGVDKVNVTFEDLEEGVHNSTPITPCNTLK